MNTINVIPTPQKAVIQKGVFKVSAATKIFLGESTEEGKFTAAQINDALKEFGSTKLSLGKAEEKKMPKKNYIFIGTPFSEIGGRLLKEHGGTLTNEMKDEGYFLKITPTCILIIAESEKGLFYGAMTLVQLLQKEKNNISVNAVTVHDYPLQKVRGITDDISRGQVSTLKDFKRIICTIARYKLNVYSPYIEDMFVFKSHPLVGKGRGALTAEEVKELDAYAKQCYVELIPIFETLGHWENILSLPEYVQYGEFPGAHTLNISDERVYSILDEMIGELSAVFTSPYFNMAADESWDVGLGANKERVAKSDLATVHSEHYKRTVDILRKYGKKPLMYGDIILNNPTILDKIPKDIIIVDWHYGASFSYRSPAIFKQAGFHFIVSPAVYNFVGPFPAYVNTFVNIQRLNLNGYRNGSLGLLTSNWNDHGGEDLRVHNYYGYAWTAECAWQPERADVAQFNKAFFKDFFGTSDEKMQTIFTILSEPLNQYNWFEVWRHPILPPAMSDENGRIPIILKVQSIQSSIPFVLNLIKSARKNVSRSADYLDALEYVAKLNLWYARKILTQERIRNLAQDAIQSQNKDSIAVIIIQLCNDVIKELAQLKEIFKSVWLRTNKPEGLELILARQERQIVYWKEIIEQMRRGDFEFNPLIESPFIYHPKGNPGIKDAPQVKKAYFRKTFTTPKQFRSAKLQLMGDTYVKLSINGKKSGEVFARRSLSLTVENKRAYIYDILPLLNDTANVFAVEAETFSERSSAGVNIYCEIEDAEGKVQKVMTDSTWKVSESVSNDWMLTAFNDNDWPNAKSKSSPSPIIKPNLSTGRTSWIER